MRSQCSIRGCKSGTAMDRHHEKYHGLPRKSLFRFPIKDPQQRQLWEKFIGRPAIDNEVLCELHFRPEDVWKDYQIVLPNGQKFAMNRGRTSLRPGAVPRYRNRSHSVVKQENVTIVQEAVQHSAGGTNQIEDSEDYDESQHSNLKNSKTVQKSTLMRDSPDSSAIDNDTDYSNNLDDNVIPSSPTSRGSSSPDISLEITLEAFSLVKSEPIDIKQEESTAPMFDTSHKMNLVKNQNPMFILQVLHDELKNTTLPDGWCHFMPNNNFLLIAHWSTCGGSAKKEIYIYKNSSMKVFFNKRPVIVNGILPGVTATNVLKNIQILRPLLLCDGTGLNNQRSDMCPGYVSPGLSHIKFGQVRCSMCLKMRKAIIEKESKIKERLSKLENKAKKLQKEKKSVKRTCQRLMAEVERLKEEAKGWKEACGRAQEKATAKEIETLCSE